jgi:NADP-dependent 3-hydroxy acid dehydrogenase YdfG
MENKTVVITGSTGGVGRALVNLFSNKRWNVIELGGKRNIDIKNYEQVKRKFSEISKVDLLINNAAIFKSEYLSNCSEIDVDNIIDTNLKGIIYCTMECLKLMNTGRIINISSVAGLHGIPKQSLYCASKHGMNGFFDALGKENKNILISTINPGGIDTPLWNSDNPYGGDTDKLLKPDDIANLVNYISELPDNVVFKEATLFPKNEEH